jgi:hypothetical protein
MFAAARSSALPASSMPFIIAALEIGIALTAHVTDRHASLRARRLAALGGCLDLAGRQVEERLRQRLHHVRETIRHHGVVEDALHLLACIGRGPRRRYRSGCLRERRPGAEEQGNKDQLGTHIVTLRH